MRKNQISTKVKNLFLTMMLIMVMALTVVGCSNKEINNTQQSSSVQMETTGSENKDNVLGEGQTKIMFTVVDMDGNETSFEIHTDKEKVGDALLENGLIAGEEGEYGLYVKTVNGITADYDVDKTYWAFYVNGEYASNSVDTTPVKEGETYTFKVEK